MRLLIIGGSGLLGARLLQVAPDRGHVAIGTRFSRRRGGLARLDIRDRGTVAAAIAETQPDAVINTASSIGDWQTTAVGPALLAQVCRERAVRLIHVSSDAVHAGRPEAYDESVDPTPQTVYGAAKAAAEVGVLTVGGDAVVARTSWIVGGGESEFESLVRDLALRRRPGALFTDDFRCPVNVIDLAFALLELAEMERGQYAGVLNMAGTDFVSRHELGVLLAKNVGLDATGIATATRVSTVGVPGVRIQLDSSRAATLLRTTLRGARTFLGAA
jgi:dTDP-4-dehydrorhamnose reductase